jgi:hypothetical protein
VAVEAAKKKFGSERKIVVYESRSNISIFIYVDKELNPSKIYRL